MALKRITFRTIFFPYLILQGCAQTIDPPNDNAILPASVDNVDLIYAGETPPENHLIDIAVNVFEMAINENESLEFGEWIFSEIRENEIHYLPYILRETLLRSNQWGAVRVLPANDPSVDLQVQAKVIASDGKHILVHVTAVDSSGRTWLDQEYLDFTTEDDFPSSTRYTPGQPFEARTFVEPFQDLSLIHI